eukprot:4263693-Pleurochrysis_carterae.AAC.9
MRKGGIDESQRGGGGRKYCDGSKGCGLTEGRVADVASSNAEARRTAAKRCAPCAPACCCRLSSRPRTRWSCPA